MILNAEDAILGRLASVAAKQALNGEEVIIVNSDKAILSGKPERVYAKFKAKRERGYPTKGPFYPRYSDKIIIRTVRGMLPYKTIRGKSALKRLKVFRNCPEKYKDVQKETVKGLKNITCKYMRLIDVSKKIGAKA